VVAIQKVTTFTKTGKEKTIRKKVSLFPSHAPSKSIPESTPLPATNPLEDRPDSFINDHEMGDSTSSSNVPKKKVCI
jgi:hypothetical protein